MTSVNRLLFFEDEIGDLLITSFCYVMWLSFNMLICHLIVTKVGMIFVEAEVLKDSNAHSLDNLDKGLIIMDEQDFSITYVNKVIQDLKLGTSESLSASTKMTDEAEKIDGQIQFLSPISK